MRLADDRRGRVPFALVGVVLLVASVSFATAITVREPGGVDSRTGQAIREAKAAARTALSAAATRAAHAAARNPLIDPANTTYGRAVNDSSSVRDGLRIRLYVAAREALARSGAVVDGVHAAVDVAPVTDAASLRRAKRSVRLERVPASPGRFRVHFRNLAVTATRNGHPVARDRYDATVTVHAPVFALADRVETFQRRLNASPAAAGLAARLTTRLNAIAWIRGIAQYRGAPIANVVANRHVALVTNEALLDEQRAAFGLSDPAGRVALQRATVRTGVTDLFAADQARAGRAGRLLAGVRSAASPDAVSRLSLPRRNATPVRNGINGTADAAFVGFRRGDGPLSLRAVVRSVYTARAELETTIQKISTDVTTETVPANARVVATNRTVRRTVSSGDGTPPSVSPPDHRLTGFVRRVTVVERTARRWEGDGRSGVARRVERTVYRVGVAVVGRHAVTDHAPWGPIDGAHAPGGPLGGQNFAGVRDRALDRLVRSQGGRGGVASAAVAERLDRGPVRIRVRPPDGIEGWVYPDLAALRERVRNVTATTGRRAFLTANPAERLVAALERERAALLDAPDSYDSVAEKARVAVRGAYLAAVERRLQRRVDPMDRAIDWLGDTLQDSGVNTTLSFRGFEPPDPAEDTVVTRVRGTPPYLTLGAVTLSDARAAGRVHPLAAHNLNVFSLPYGETADALAGVLGGGGDGRRARLRTAGRALGAANATLSRARNATLRSHRNRLRATVAASLDAVDARLQAVLNDTGSLTPAQRRAAVQGARERWGAIHAQALAAANGSLADAVAARAPLGEGTRRDWVRERLRLALQAATQNRSIQPPSTPVTATGTAVRNLADRALRTAARAGVEKAGEAVWRRWVGDALVAVPAGLPVLPVPGYWYATVNVWTVTARGQYERFAVRARGTGPRRPNLTYVRRNATVALDVDGDGQRDRLGRNRRITFTAQTAVVVVVPPGGSGVGDPGEPDERSPGWPEPGPE